ncbi:MAG: hypothetical protein ACMG6E_04230, partial [Candidatus Roizmanbacteria bacterium]
VRLDNGLPFATIQDNEGKKIPFTVDRKMVSLLKLKEPSADVLSFLGDSIAESFASSLGVLMNINSHISETSQDPSLLAPPLEADFDHPYVAELFKVVQTLSIHAAANTKRGSHELHPTDTIFRLGANTGGEICVQAYGLLANRSKLIARSLLLANTPIETITNLRAHLGIKAFDRSGNPLNRDFALIKEDERFGLNEGMISRLSAEAKPMGCPASIPVSHDTTIFLRSIGIPHKGVMLRYFAESIADRFDGLLGNWFRALDDRERTLYVSVIDTMILEGRTDELKKIGHRPEF